MMIRVTLLATALVAASPALACHRFAVWRFPWPQTCGVNGQRRAPDGLSAFAAPARPGPVVDPDPERDLGLRRLREAIARGTGK